MSAGSTKAAETPTHLLNTNLLEAHLHKQKVHELAHVGHLIEVGDDEHDAMVLGRGVRRRGGEDGCPLTYMVIARKDLE